MTMKHRTSITLSVGILVAGFAAAQDQTPHPWRSVNDPPPAGVAAEPAPPDQSQNQGFAADQQNPPAQPLDNPAPPPDAQQTQAAPPPPPAPAPPVPQQQGQQLPTNYGPNYAPPVNVPPQLSLRQGTYVIVRTNQWLSSDRNQPGDTFTATLEQPLVVDGFVVAPRGATVVGRVTEAKKAGRVEGTSRLGVELTEINLVDGQQLPIQSQIIGRNGPTSQGRDAAAIGGTTALGAAIGAGVGWGRGAAIGAGAGAAAGIIGVLLTRGQPTVIYPESVLTFQTTVPATVSTDRAPQSFQYVTPQDYQQQPYISQRPPAAPYGAPAPPPAYGYGYGYYPPYPYAYSYPYPYYPYYGGVGIFIGRGWGYRRWR